MSTEQKEKWIHLATPSHKIDAVTKINAQEFVAVSFGNSSIQKYNIHDNTFTHLVDTQIENTKRIAFNQEINHIYLHDSGNKLHAIDLNTQQKILTNNVPKNEDQTYLLCINNKLHIINNYDKHYIGSIQNNKENMTLDCLHNTLDNDHVWTVTSAQLVYIPSKQSILLISGFEQDTGAELLTDIWMYSLVSEKWKQIENINGSFAGYQFAAVLSSDEKYVILLGGSIYNKDIPGDEAVDDIFVLDMNDDNHWKIVKSSIRCPRVSFCMGVRTGGIDSKNKLLVTGFVRECFQMKGFETLLFPPVYIIMIIVKWFNQEMVHWMNRQEHYGIYLKDILNSLCT